MVSAQEAILSIFARSGSFLLKLDFEKAFDNVKWSFMFKLLRAKGFSEAWIGWMEECLCSSRLSCLINGILREPFKMRKGLKKGCPLSLSLFIIVVDSMDAFFKTAVREGFLDSSSDGRRRCSLTNLHFADDTLLFSSAGEDRVVILKLLLYCFELASGLEINFAKSSLIYIGRANSELQVAGAVDKVPRAVVGSERPIEGRLDRANRKS